MPRPATKKRWKVLQLLMAELPLKTAGPVGGPKSVALTRALRRHKLKKRHKKRGTKTPTTF
jgi:hypothetical protein